MTRTDIHRQNAHTDRRTLAAMVSPAYEDIEVISRGRARVTLNECIVENLIDDEVEPEGWDGVIEADVRYEVCDLCSGHGTVVDPEIDAGGLTREDFEERGPDFRRDYFRGAYDVQCPTCKGERVTPVLTLSKTIQRAVDRFLDAEADYASVCAAERRMGA